MAKLTKLCPWYVIIAVFLGASSCVWAQEEKPGGITPGVRLDLASEPSAAFPRPAPVHHDTERGEIDLALGFSYLRFRSSQFNANTYGTTTDFTYFVAPWWGVEGDISTGWGSQSASSAEAKSIVYGAGVRVVRPHERAVRPWGHMLLGGIHMYPQTAFSNNAFAATLGGGADIRLRHWWLWLRVEGNYTRSQLYASGQNDLRVSTSIVYRF